MANAPSTDPRMISGAAISNVVFLEISGLAPDGTAGLRALAVHEIWLESRGETLDQLPARLEIGEGDAPARLLREADGYCVRLTLPAPAAEALRRRLTAGARPALTLRFDVEYHEGFESPGGYDSAHGVRYWDDVTYPDVQADGFELEG